MNKEIKDSEVYDAISCGFSSFRILAKNSLKPEWRNMSRHQRYAAGRALVYIGNLSKINNWDESFGAKKNIDYALNAFHGDMELCNMFYYFCSEIEFWSKNNKSKNVVNKVLTEWSAKKVIISAKQLRSLVEIHKSNIFIRPVKELILSFRQK